MSIDVAFRADVLARSQSMNVVHHFRGRPIRSHSVALFSRVAAMLTLSIAAHAETIALWSFETDPPANLNNSAASPNITADAYNGVGSATANGFHASGNTDWSTPAGNGSANSFSSNTWAIGDFYQFTLATTNFQGIQVSWDQTRSSTGPGLFDFAYSLDGTSFTTFLNGYSVGTRSWSTGATTSTSSFTCDLSALAELDNAASVTFRLIATEAPTGTTGANRVDNFLVSGSILTSGANSLFWDTNGAAAGLGGSGTWNENHWTPSETGTASVQTFDAAKKAVFGGTSGNVSIDTTDVTANNGLQFDSDQYTISATAGRKLTLGGASPQISVVSAGHRATVTAEIAGSNGFTKLGDGMLRLDGDNTYTGVTTITAGTLEITHDHSLGAIAAGVALNNGTLKPVGSITLNSGRALTGTGTVEVSPGETLTITGTVNAGTVTLRGGGTMRMNGSSSMLSGLVFDDAATVGGTGTLTINGSITAAQATGTSTIDAPLNLGSFATTSGNRVVTVNETSSVLAIPNSVTLIAPLDSGQATPLPNNNGRLHKLGAGVLELTGNNSGLFGVRLGSAATSSSGNPISPVDGGTLRINNNTALGANLFQFNAGTLHIMQALTGANALPNAMTIGASSEIPAVISGADVEFLGEVQLFRPNASIQHTLIVNTNVRLSGPLNAPTSMTGSSTGLTIGGNGSLTLAAASNTISEEITIDGPSVTLNGTLDGTMGVHLNNGTLQGNGSLSFAVLSVGDGAGADAVFSPGNGVVNYTMGGLMLESDAVLKLQLNSSQQIADSLQVEGIISLGEGIAELEVSDLGSAALPIGFEFTLIKNNGFGPVIGYFDGMPDLHRFTVGPNIFEIDYGSSAFDPEDVTLTVVPEPGAAVLFLSGAILLGRIRRRSARRCLV